MALVKVSQIDAFVSRRQKRQFKSNKALEKSLALKNSYFEQSVKIAQRDVFDDIEHVKIILKNINCKKVDKIINYIRKNTDT